MTNASEDDDLVPISALQHFAFCPRQCALIHLERSWAENDLTAEGRVVHERVDLPGFSGRGRIARGVQLRCDRLGLSGRADVVEFLAPPEPGEPETPFPIEYKRGSSTGRLPDRVQLCAQAMALEEMTGAAVPRGAIFHHASRRREVIGIDDALRRETANTVHRVRRLLQGDSIPKAEIGPKCRRCSLRELCEPATADLDPSRYLADAVRTSLRSEPE